MVPLKLSGPDFKLVRRMIQDCFSLEPLDLFILENYPDFHPDVPWGGTLSVAAKGVVRLACNHGVLDELAARAAAERPARVDLRALSFYLAGKGGWTPEALGHGLNVARVLEGLVTSPGDPFLDTSRLAHGMVRVERQVCIVRCGSEHGTGFLVAPDLVLTCHHV